MRTIDLGHLRLGVVARGRGHSPAFVVLLVCVVGSCGGDNASSMDGGRDAPWVPTENTAATCQDGQDNDGDGLTDCADQDCWPLTFCAEERPDGWTPSTDGGPGDGFHDAPYQGDGSGNFDTGLQSCAIHYDCPQGEFCYKGKCLRDKKQAVFHCGKPGCPPGHWCLTQANAKELCAEDPSYVCQDACDCGPAHCCEGGRCVKDVNDYWRPGPGVGTSPPGACTDSAPTYCCEAPSCHAGREAFGEVASAFVCYSRAAGAPSNGCGGPSCLGTAQNCGPGEQCVETVESAPVGASCHLSGGGHCISSAQAEVLFGYQPAEVVPKCAAGCAVGRLCDAGALRAEGKWTFQRVIARCGPCADGVHHSCGTCGDAQNQCDPWEGPTLCPSDCSCGDGVCSVEESDGQHPGFCPTDCGKRVTDPATQAVLGVCDDDGSCEPWEHPDSCGDCTCSDAVCSAGEVCPADCAGRCPGAPNLPAGKHRFCGDGLCQATGTCGEAEACNSCPADCGTCRWQKVLGNHAWRAQGLYGLWGSSANDVFAVGDAGTIVHHDGQRWSPMASGTTERLDAVWGSSGSDVFAAGISGTLLHYDGQSWNQIALPPGVTPDLRGVWKGAGDEVFVVGSEVAPDSSVVAAVVGRDAQGWKKLGLPQPAPKPLHGVWGSTASDVFAVGDGGTILHYDGQSWSAMSSGTTERLDAVWGSSGSDVFAVGDGGTVLHYDGQGWSAMVSGTTQRLWALWGSSGSDVFAAGQDSSAVLHYDGQSWSAMPSATKQHLRGLWGSAAGDVWAVGLHGTTARYDGQSWSETVSGLGAQWLWSVWGSSGSDVFAVGDGGTILHHDGQSWSEMSSGTPQWLWDVWGSSGNDVFAVGALGTILHYDGQGWSPMASNTTAWLWGVWGSSGSDVFAVGSGGTVSHYDGQSWSPMTSNTTASFRGAWGSSGSDVFAVGFGGTISHYDGQSWSAMASGTTAWLWGVWGSGPGDVFAVGDGGTILHYDGQSWSAMASGTQQALYGVTGNSGNDVFAVSLGGTILHFDGQSWKPARANTGEPNSSLCGALYGIAGVSGGDVFAVGEHSTVWRYFPGGVP